MIRFKLNSEPRSYEGKDDRSLLSYLRETEHLTAVKDGCSGEGTCGACLTEVNGKARLACSTKMHQVEGAEIITLEGVPGPVREALGKAFVESGAVQCGFCTPGLLMRTRILLRDHPSPSREEIRRAIHPHLCRCTGYVKIIDAIEAASRALSPGGMPEHKEVTGKVGTSYPKYEAYRTALGERPFADDLRLDGMLRGALKFSDHPRARVLKIDTGEASRLEGVTAVFTAADIPGDRYSGLIFKDWPLMVPEGEVTRYIGDVLAGVVAEDEETARRAISLIRVEYEALPPVTDPETALLPSSPQVHPDRSNKLETCLVKRGEAEMAILNSAFVTSGFYETQRIEHAFLEKETALASRSADGGIELFSQGQGVYVDRTQIAVILGLPEDKVRITQVSTGGGFGGKEDLTVQGHAALYAWLTGKPVKVGLTRQESIRMHPKRHPVSMQMTLACDRDGKLTALRLRAVGDTGAYASVGNKVMERVAGHASGAYYVPEVDIEAITVYTNNVPCGAMRGFGVNQVNFALESCMDELCRMGGFDPWQFRYDNALMEGLATATGQVLEAGIGVRATLEAVKEEYLKAKFKGLACGIKNSGVGNGMPDESFVKIEVLPGGHVKIDHGWTEMGQGVHTIAIQTLAQETGIDPQSVEVATDTRADLPTGMTTSSRATALLGNAIIDAARDFRKDLQAQPIEALAGRIYRGGFICDWTTKPGAKVDKVVTHFAYGYATQLVILDDNGKVEKVVAAHDAGKIMNPLMFEGQIEGAVHMGLGYALSEDLPMKDGFLVSSKLKDCGVLRSTQTPDIKVIGVEVTDPVGPYGAKGIGEIGLVPTAAAVANALCNFDGTRRYKLPLK